MIERHHMNIAVTSRQRSPTTSQAYQEIAGPPLQPCLLPVMSR